MKLNTWTCVQSVYIACNKSTTNLNMIVSPVTSTVFGELLLNLTTESGSFWTEGAIKCHRAFSNVIISAECRHTNCDSYIKIYNWQKNWSAITHISLSKHPVSPLLNAVVPLNKVRETLHQTTAVLPTAELHLPEDGHNMCATES